MGLRSASSAMINSLFSLVIERVDTQTEHYVVFLLTSQYPQFHLVSNDQLRGKTPLEGALIQQYVNFADQEILPAVVTWVFPTLGLMQFNKQVCKFFFSG